MYKEPDWLDRQMFMLIENELAEWINTIGYWFLTFFLIVAAVAFIPLFGSTVTVWAMSIGATLLFFWPAITVCLIHLIDMISAKISLDKS